MTFGLTASGQGYSGVSTPVTAGGGVQQTFNLGSLGIGTSGTLGDVSASNIPTWLWYVGAAALAWYLFKVRR